MGKKTRRPSEGPSSEALGPDEPVSECPYNQTGALRFLVRRAEDLHTPVQGVRIWLGGPQRAPQNCITDARGQANFVNKQTGGYMWEANYAFGGLEMLVEEEDSGNVGIRANERRIIPLYVRQLGELVVEVRRDENGRPGALLEDALVASIEVHGQREEGVARTQPGRGPAGRAEVRVTLASDAWAVATEDMHATVRGGERTTFVVRAAESTWLRPQVWDVAGGQTGTGAWLSGAEVTADTAGTPRTIRTRDETDPRTRAPKPLADYDIVEVRTPDRRDEDDLYMFEELA